MAAWTWAASPSCSGHGVVVNSSAVPSGFACICDVAYSGSSDMFDLRVPDSGGQSLDCLVPIVGVNVMWALVMVFALQHLAYTLASIRYTVQTKRGSCSRLLSLRRENTVFFILLFDLFVVAPLSLAAAALKLSDTPHNSQVIGTDYAVTVIFSLFVSSSVVMWSTFDSHQYAIIARTNQGGKRGNKDTNVSIRRVSTANVFLTLSYIFLTVVPTLVMLSRDKTVGPVANGSWWLLVTRNMGVVLWQFCALFTAWRTEKEITQLLGMLQLQPQPVNPSAAASSQVDSSSPSSNNSQGQHSSDDANTSQSPQKSSAQIIIETFANQTKDNLRKNTIALILYAIFSLPFAWPFETFVIAFALILLLLNMAPGKVVFKTSLKIKKTSKFGAGSKEGGKTHSLIEGSANLWNQSIADAHITVLRSGLESAPNLQELEDDIANGEVLDDDGTQVSVITKHVLIVDEIDTPLGRVAPRIVDWGMALIRSLKSFTSRFSFVLFWAVFSLGVFVVAALELNKTVIQDQIYSLVFIIFSVYDVILMLALINIKIAKRICRTGVFWVRISSAVVSSICLCINLPDGRISIILALLFLQVFVALGDAMAGFMQPVRVLILVQLIVALISLLVLLYFDLLPYTYFTVVISSSFDYATMQLARDLYLGTLIVCLFDLSFVLTAAKKRFQFIQRPVRFVIVLFSEEETTSGRILQLVKKHGGVGGSQLEVQSGFLVGDARPMTDSERAVAGASADAASQANNVRFFVDMVCLKQSDSLSVHWFGLNRGKRLFSFLTSGSGKFIEAFFALLLGAVVLASPYYANLGFLGLPMLIFHIFREFSRFSRVMLHLLMRRRAFAVHCLFVLIWYALFCVVFQNDVIILGMCVVGMSLTEALKDATLVPRTKGLARIRNKILVAVLFAIFSAQMVFNAYPNLNHVYVDFRPDTKAQRENSSVISYSDSPSVVDLFQQCADLSIALSVGHLINSVYIFLFLKFDEFQHIRIPVQPSFVSSAPELQSARALAGEFKTPHEARDLNLVIETDSEEVKASHRNVTQSERSMQPKSTTGGGGAGSGRGKVLNRQRSFKPMAPLRSVKEPSVASFVEANVPTY